MTELELRELFTPEEYERFLEFMIENNYFWSKDSCYVESVQDFLSVMEDNERKEEIICTCITKFPKILGFGITL